MKLAIVGSREWTDFDRLAFAADALNPSSIVSGGASGADALARRYAQERGLPLTEHLPDETKGFPACFHIRNRQIAADCGQVLACIIGDSRGTASTVREARRLGKPVTILEAFKF